MCAIRIVGEEQNNESSLHTCTCENYENYRFIPKPGVSFKCVGTTLPHVITGVNSSSLFHQIVQLKNHGHGWIQNHLTWEEFNVWLMEKITKTHVLPPLNPTKAWIQRGWDRGRDIFRRYRHRQQLNRQCSTHVGHCPFSFQWCRASNSVKIKTICYWIILVTIIYRT